MTISHAVSLISREMSSLARAANSSSILLLFQFPAIFFHIYGLPEWALWWIVIVLCVSDTSHSTYCISIFTLLHSLITLLCYRLTDSTILKALPFIIVEAVPTLGFWMNSDRPVLVPYKRPLSSAWREYRAWLFKHGLHMPLPTFVCSVTINFHLISIKYAQQNRQHSTPPSPRECVYIHASRLRIPMSENMSICEQLRFGGNCDITDLDQSTIIQLPYLHLHSISLCAAFMYLESKQCKVETLLAHPVHSPSVALLFLSTVLRETNKGTTVEYFVLLLLPLRSTLERRQRQMRAVWIRESERPNRGMRIGTNMQRMKQSIVDGVRDKLSGSNIPACRHNAWSKCLAKWQATLRTP